MNAQSAVPARSRKLPLALWTAFLFTGSIALVYVLSSQPYDEQTLQPWLGNNITVYDVHDWFPKRTVHYGGQSIPIHEQPMYFMDFLFRKSAHVLLYGGMAVVAAAVWGRLLRSLPLTIGCSLLTVLLIALLDEWNQQFSSRRSALAADVWLDMAGAIIAVSLYAGYRFYKERNNKSIHTQEGKKHA
ncbi:VanZ family protein [Paenibacillus sp. y28]|uniref:VanZ family protein n=1 Tax=Paenibacillus sp. y28 TaxID=3129110 RepID=UPI003018FFEA